MNKKILVIIVLFLLAVSLFAIGSVDLTGKVNLGGSLYGTWIMPSVQADYMFLEFLGIGAELKGYFGLDYGDIYTSATAFGKLGPFYLGGGVSAKLKDAASEDITIANFDYGDSDSGSEGPGVLPVLTAGLLFPIFEIGPGKLGFNTAIDYIITDIPITVDEDQSFGANFLSIILQALIGATAGGIKISVGANYTM